MSAELGDGTETTATVTELTNTIAATAAGLENAKQTLRTARRIATIAARHPEQLAALGMALIATAGVLALRGPKP